MRDPNLVLRQTLIPLLAVLGAIGGLSILVYWIRVWWRDSDGPAVSDHDLLSEYRELHRQGELSDEEFRIIKSRFLPRIGNTAGSRASPPGEQKGSVEKDFRPGNS